MKHTGTEPSLRVFQIFRAKDQHVALRRSLGSFEEYRQALHWMREQGHSLDSVVRLVAAGEHPWRAS